MNRRSKQDFFDRETYEISKNTTIMYFFSKEKKFYLR